MRPLRVTPLRGLPLTARFARVLPHKGGAGTLEPRKGLVQRRASGPTIGRWGATRRIETRWEYDQAMAVPSSAQAAHESIGLSAVSSQERFEQPGARRSKDFLHRPCRLNYRDRDPRITVRNRRVSK